MDDLLKYKFETIYEIGEYEIDNYPLFLNTDGCTLIVKDKSDKPRDANETELQLYCRPRGNNTKKSLMSSASNSTLNSSGSSDNDANSKITKKIKPSTKDKGLVITVKKNFEGGNFIDEKNIIQEE